MTHRISTVNSTSRSNLVACLIHELLELYGERCKIHDRDSKFFDPKQIRKAIRQAHWKIEYFAAKDVFEIADIAMERRVPPGRTKNSKTELRKNAGYKGIINPPSELQAIWQAMPKKYWELEQKVWFEEVKGWLQKAFPGAVGLITLHTDKNRLHVEYVLLKFGADRKLLPCFKKFKHDGPGTSGNRATAAIKGHKYSKEEREKMKFNSTAEIDLALSMRRRFMQYFREMGRELRGETIRKAREVLCRLERDMHKKSRDRREKQQSLDAARFEYQAMLKSRDAGKSPTPEPENLKTEKEESSPLEEHENSVEGPPREEERPSVEDKNEESLKAITSAQKSPTLILWDTINEKETTIESRSTIQIQDKDLFNKWMRSLKAIDFAGWTDEENFEPMMEYLTTRFKREKHEFVRELSPSVESPQKGWEISQ